MSVSRMILVNCDNHSGLLPVVYFPKHYSYHVIPWSRAVAYKLIIMQMGKKFPPGVETEGSLHIHVSTTALIIQMTSVDTLTSNIFKTV